MKEYKVNKNLRITIPLALRKKFGLETGTRVCFIEEKDGIKILPILPRFIDKNIEFMKVTIKKI